MANTIQIRDFIDYQQLFYHMQYKRSLGGYVLEITQDNVSKQAILLIIKILLASRSLTKQELTTTINGLLNLTTPSDQQEIRPIIRNEQFYYVPVHHGQPLLRTIWAFSQFITKKQAVDIDYQRQHGECKHYTILPEAVIFSEYYFYIISYSPEGNGDRFFRADRIRNFHQAPVKITQSYADRFEDGELRQHIQYMQPGKKITLQFEYWGIVEAALDRFPNAIIKARYPEKDSVLIEAEAYDAEAKMWLLSQGNLVKVISPISFKKIIVREINTTLIKYNASN
ncbi:helix-turn-helix transcriptional regulator [Furfurilactobacillus rossiae]|uniref:WYL domain-containing protein n=1 Tax=Furfurilactobacillus rossiae DSM 15814 TaxID=1114972 RepID=A0A0R1RIL8_9LACO|nr:WYL domain-containing protein [Furfurilactobacillus rossiae]KRL53523.1 hypothetical protein FD35_GL001062 [Furfurilactobacillus rossiae DSM 15814]QFR67658.1 WYL domain-containing protein [Furfurilactobacillus rossiae]QLE60619.1 hypothetical protein LROSRS0_0571 [Furfurilactobacillus rossiae]